MAFYIYQRAMIIPMSFYFLEQFWQNHGGSRARKIFKYLVALRTSTLQIFVAQNEIN